MQVSRDSDSSSSSTPAAVNGADNELENRQPAVRPRSRSRARITNGSKLLPSVSGTSVWARILRDTIDSLVVHLGGDDHVTEPQRMACRRIAVLETELVHMEDAMGTLRCEGKAPPPEMLDLYARLGNSQRRFCEALGWQRVPREVAVDLRSYLAAKSD